MFAAVGLASSDIESFLNSFPEGGRKLVELTLILVTMLFRF